MLEDKITESPETKVSIDEYIREIFLFFLFSGVIPVYYWRNARLKINPKHLVVITGCDSGLGYSLALHCRSLGAAVVAGVLNLESKNAKNLEESGVSIRELNVLLSHTITDFTAHVLNTMKENNLGERRITVGGIIRSCSRRFLKQIKHSHVVSFLGSQNLRSRLIYMFFFSIFPIDHDFVRSVAHVGE